ncbi:membrane protein [Clostridia bacterium]|nr:membrane protein [Clostridia bacterium]
MSIISNNDTSQAVVYDQAALSAFMKRVFMWLFSGLLVTGLVSMAVLSNPAFLFASAKVVMLLLIVEVGLVFFLAGKVMTMSPTVARIVFMVYSVINGVTISFIVVQYAGAVISQAFMFTALFFGILCLYGQFTTRDLSSMRTILFAGLITVIIFSVVNLFLGNGMLNFFISIVGLAVFVGLTAYDAQKIRTRYFPLALQTGRTENMAISCALTLYLDFINMFLFILRLLGGRK